MAYLRYWPRNLHLRTGDTAQQGSSVLAYSVDTWITHLFQLFRTLGRKADWQWNTLEGFPEPILYFDPAVLWKIWLITTSCNGPWSFGWDMESKMMEVQQRLHFLICTLSVGDGEPSTRSGECLRICSKAAQLLKHAESAQRFATESRKHFAEREASWPTANEIDNVLAQFQKQILDRVSPAPARRSESALSFPTARSNARTHTTSPILQRREGTSVSATFTPLDPFGHLSMSSTRDPRGGVNVKPEDIKGNNGTSRRPKLTTPKPASRPPARNIISANEPLKKPGWRL